MSQCFLFISPRSAYGDQRYILPAQVDRRSTADAVVAAGEMSVFDWQGTRYGVYLLIASSAVLAWWGSLIAILLRRGNGSWRIVAVALALLWPEDGM